MGRINLVRVLIGGFIAGIIINASEFVLNTMLVEEEMNAAMAALNKPPVDPSMIIWFVHLQLRLWIHSGLDVCRHQAAIRRRRENRRLRVDVVLGARIPLPEPVFHRHESLSSTPDDSHDGLGAGRSRHRRHRRRVGIY